MTDGLLILSNGGCKNSCLFCAAKMHKTSFETIKGEADALLSQGVRKFILAGADAGEYENLVDLVKYLKGHGCQVELLTHGRPLKDLSLTRALKMAGLEKVRISLYGSTAKIHNSIVQSREVGGDAFEETLQGIRNAAHVRLTIIGSVPVVRPNKDDLQNTINLFRQAAQGELEKLYVRTIFIGENDRSKNYTGDWFLPLNEMKPYVQHLQHVRFLEIPYCVVEDKNYAFIENSGRGDLLFSPEYAESEFANGDINTYAQIPECTLCKMKDRCSGVPINELRLFGVQGFIAIH